jgi:hypothetical protein
MYNCVSDINYHSISNLPSPLMFPVHLHLPECVMKGGWWWQKSSPKLEVDDQKLKFAFVLCKILFYPLYMHFTFLTSVKCLMVLPQ